MTFSYRTALLLGASALLLPLLAACGDDSDLTPVDSPSATAGDVTMGTVMDSHFVSDFKVAFPKLGKGRDDDEVATNGADACARIETDKAIRDDLLGEVAQDFTANGLAPNEETAIKIMNLAVKDACPKRASNLKAVLARP